MKTLAILTACLLALPCSAARTPGFASHFADSTLRLDYVFCGDARHQQIYLREARVAPVWAGRRARLEAPLLRGNGQIRVLDPADGACLYANSFSSLFQEWTVTEEAVSVPRAFENSLQVPWPKHPVRVEVTLYDTHGKVAAQAVHPVDPADILIRPVAPNGLRTEVVHGSKSPSEAIDVVIVSEGYAEADAAKFFGDARRAADALFSHEPFKTLEDRFTVRAVFAPSAESGVSVPHDGLWKSTAAASHFDTFYSQRYLTTPAIWHICDLIATVPYEHIIVLANTPIYGGGGIYNSITIMNSDHPTFVPVIVHEFGHAFAGLGDEYYYDDQFDTMYPADTEPWEPNLTTLVDFGSKWADMIFEDIEIPTPPDAIERTDIRGRWHTLSPAEKDRLNTRLGVYEGGGYTSKGVYRPAQECRMKINECERFCPVCTRAIAWMTDYYTKP